jgi:hypothetical protein
MILMDQLLNYINLFLVTKNSNPKLISDFIKKRIELVFDSFHLDDSFISNMNTSEKPGVLIQYEKINIHQWVF